MFKRYLLYFCLLTIISTFFTLVAGFSGFKEYPETFSNFESSQNLSYVKNDMEALKKEAQSEFYNGNLSKSKELYQFLLEEEYDKIEVIKNLITIYKNEGDVENVISYYKRLISLQPDNIIWKLEYGISLYQSAKYKKAEAVLSNIENTYLKELSQRNTSLLYYYLGDCYIELNQIDNALNHFEQGIEEEKSLILNYWGRAKVNQIKQKPEKVIDNYQTVLRWDPSLSILYPELAYNFEQINDYENAYYFWERSENSGIKVELAKSKLEKLEDKRPELKEEEEDVQEKEEPEVINFKDITPIEEVNEIPQIRVGLIDRAREITFISKSDFDILDSDKKIILSGESNSKWNIISENNMLKFYKDNQLKEEISFNSEISIIPDASDATTIFYNINYGENYFWAGNENRQYRGEFKLNKNPDTPDSFTLINKINLEEYLFSVIPSEMPAWWPEEALKSQAIAARSYALYNIDRHSNQNYNLCATMHCAVYNGTQSENSRTNKAVLETKGEVATYEDKVINAVFSSNSGGYTENSKDVWQSDIPYLSATSNMTTEDFSFPLSPYDLKEWLQNSPPSYSYNPVYTGHNKYRWIRPISTDFLKEKYNLDELINITPLQISYGGSIERLLLKGKNKKIIIKNDSIRSALGGLRSNRFIIEKNYNSEGELVEIILYGGGWGHNVGLDQSAAAGMAEEGFEYEEIITHFYPGTKIGQFYD